MRETAERRAEPAGLSPLQRLVAPADRERIVRLFAGEGGTEAAETADPADPDTDLDWPAAIRLIRDAGGRIRQARAGAEDATRRAHALVGRSAQAAETAEQRARAAETAAEQAERRAEQAEAAHAAAEAKASAAEAKAVAAEERARRAEEEAAAARNVEAEARLWLRRLLACLKTELSDAAEAPDPRP